MERLTARDNYGDAYYPHCFRVKECEGVGASERCNTCDFSVSTCEKLAAYEDLGLTPEQLKVVDQMYAEICWKLAERENV